MKYLKNVGFGLLVVMTTFTVNFAEAARGDFSPSRSGITHMDAPRSHPNGTNNAQFNRFIDSSAWAYHIGEASTKTDFSGNRAYYDERDFVVARKCFDASCSFTHYEHTVSAGLSNNDVIRAKVWLHNNARNGTAPVNTQVTLDWSNPKNVKATINAAGATPTVLNDIVTISDMSTGKTFQLVGRIRENSNAGGSVTFGLNHAKVLNKTNTSVTFNVGSIIGCYGGVHILDFDLKVINATPRIKIVKTDLNPGTDQDGSQRNDSQTINTGESAGFEITVTNTGNEALRNVVVTDAEAPACARTAAQTRTLYTGSTFVPGDSFTYNCTANNVTATTFADGDNDSSVVGIGVGSGTSVNDQDPSVILLVTPPTPAEISLLKWAANPKDKDGVKTGNNAANDTQSVESVDPDDKAVFRIEVENTGGTDLKNVRVYDTNAAACALTTAQVKTILTTGASPKGTVSNVNVSGLSNNNDKLEVGEKFRYDCTQDGTRDGYTNRATTVGEPVNGDPNVNDSDTSEVLICNDNQCPTPNPGPGIEIIKTDLNAADQDGVQRNDTQTINETGQVRFEITVTSTKDEALKNVVVTDVETPDCNLTAAQTKALYPGDFFDRGESFTYTCVLGNVLSTTFADGDNDIAVTGKGKNSNTVVNDDDPSLVVVVPPVCGNQIVEPPEQCDDGNLVNGDGCSSQCTIEVGPACGDGTLDAGEQCDDGNLINGDGCSAVCELEPSCVGTPTFDPNPVGPNSASTFSWVTTNTGTEVKLECSGPGLSLTTNVPATGTQVVTVPLAATASDTYRCEISEGAANLCAANLTIDPTIPYCGDGVKNRPAEECDDGNSNDTDACSNACILTIPPYEISLLKFAKNPNDKDGVITGGNVVNDTQTVESVDPLDLAIFRIVIENTGRNSLENVRVDDNKAPECALSADEVREILTTGASSKSTISNVSVVTEVTSNNIFESTEKFQYDCTQDGVRDGYTNRARTVGEPVDGSPVVNASDTSVVVVCNGPTCPPGPDPSIQIIKQDANPNDYDNNIIDSQLIAEGDTAVFVVTVTNNGSEALRDIVISDDESPQCARTAIETWALYPGFNFDPGETFTYNCDKTNAQPGDFDGANGQGSVDGENDVRVDAVSVTTTTAVNDEDPSEVKFLPVCTLAQGQISINKDDSTPGQPDTDGDDTQLVGTGGTAEFTITVSNPGTSAISDVSVTDVNSPACARTAAEFMTLLGAVGNNDDKLDPGEIVTYTCEQANVTVSFTNTARVSGINTTVPCSVSATDDSAVVASGGAGFCGDGIVQPPEDCDSGGANGTAGSSCSSTCTNVCVSNCGTSDRNPVVGTCSLNGAGNPQCSGRKPVEDVSDPLWQIYRQCKQGIDPIINGPFHTGTGLLLDELCALDWAENQGLLLCGSTFGGTRPLDPFTDPNTAEISAQCGITTVCPDCVTPCVKPTGCSGCFATTSTISKKLKAVTTDPLADEATVAKGEDVTYEIVVDINGFDHTTHEIVAAQIMVHDVVIPSASGNIWDRKGIKDGDGDTTWTWCDENVACDGLPEGQGEYFYLDMNVEKADGSSMTYVEKLNAGGATTLKVHYDMDTDVASTHDAAAIKNVAFAMIKYTYQDLATLTPVTKMVGLGGPDVCKVNPTLQNLAHSTLGDTAQVNIIRPFIKARAGNAGYYGGTSTDKAFADQEGIAAWNGGVLDPTDFNYGLTLTDNATVYTGAEQGNATDFADFQDQQDAFYDNLEDAASDMKTFGTTTFEKLPGAPVYQLDGQSLDVAILSGLTQSSTFIITNGDVEINTDFALPTGVFAAFIIRNGDLLINENVSAMDGMYMVEQGEVKSSPDGTISNVQLKVSGNLFGNLGHLLSYRRYIGSGVDIEPSIEINFDLRLLDNTPPMLEQFLGDGWRDDIQE